MKRPVMSGQNRAALKAQVRAAVRSGQSTESAVALYLNAVPVRPRDDQGRFQPKPRRA